VKVRLQKKDLWQTSYWTRKVDDNSKKSCRQLR